MPADLSSSLGRTERNIVRRKRHQQGSLQVKKHGKHKMWILQYREGTSKKYHTLGLYSKMSKSEAQQEQARIMSEVNARLASDPDPNITFGNFLEGVALPFYRSKWKRSTAATTESRMTYHLAEFSETKLQAITLKSLQAFLSRKAEDLSRSVVAHLRWDLRAVFKLALAEGYTQRDPTAALYTPKEASVVETRVMTGKEVEQYIGVLDMRERVIAHLAIFAGMRPGEILGLQRKHVSHDGKAVTIEQRVYRGDIDTPKTASSKRAVASGPVTAALLAEWMQWVGEDGDAWVFASEGGNTPIWRDNIWYRYMKPKLEPIGLGWANFQVLRRTHASLGHEAGVDPKVAADQRGHGIGVALDVYTKAALSKRAQAAEQLENAVLSA
ncbi:MAG: tyrosine-type recombinase/integrase [Bryobacteraceae bacterium]|nr:tyrosine-type recombinase/integrase [Bryobacteraceae bacterium]